MRQLAVMLGLFMIIGCGFSSENAAPDRLNGARCDSADQCKSGMTCVKTPYYDWNVCSGSVDRGGACGNDSNCKYVRNELGLPLRCLNGVCQHQDDLQLKLDQ